MHGREKIIVRSSRYLRLWHTILIIITLTSAVTRAECINLYLFVYLLLGRESGRDGNSAVRQMPPILDDRDPVTV